MMAWLGSLLKWIVLVPVILAVLLLGLANDQPVTLHLNPFDPSDPALSFDLLLYQIAFLIFVVGALVGAFVSWSGQRRYRRRAWERGEAAKHWQYRARKAEEGAAGPDAAGVPALAAPQRR